MIVSAGRAPGSDRPLSSRRLTARTVMSWWQTIWQESRTPVRFQAGFLRGRFHRGCTIDKFDAARSASCVATTGVHDVDLGILFDGKDEPLVLGEVECPVAFNS